jgi:hypothetical protein
VKPHEVGAAESLFLHSTRGREEYGRGHARGLPEFEIGIDAAITQEQIRDALDLGILQAVVDYVERRLATIERPLAELEEASDTGMDRSGRAS